MLCFLSARVSILVLVDVPLKHIRALYEARVQEGFNPCFGGCFIKTTELFFIGAPLICCFNPCFGGCSIKTKKRYVDTFPGP